MDKYSEDLPVAMHYNKKELEEELKVMFVEPLPEDLGTPEEVLDPINYVFFTLDIVNHEKSFHLAQWKFG